MRQLICLLIAISVLSPVVSTGTEKITKKEKTFKLDPGFDPDDEDPLPPYDNRTACLALKKQFLFLVRNRSLKSKSNAWRIGRFAAAAQVANEAITAGCW